MKVVHSRRDFLAARAALAGRVGLVPTMGALHAGHGALLAAARAETDSVVATIFVNPLQFGPAEDLARYPRTLDADLAHLEQWGAALVWAPAVEDVYAAGPVRVTVSPGPLGDELEGAVRPGHFAGVLTVVAKFLNLVHPDDAYFGEKDYQQLTLTRRMAADLDLGVRIVGVPTVREPDGLALSSRNVYLAPDERIQALGLSRALAAGAAAASAPAAGAAHAGADEASNQRRAQGVLGAAHEVLAEHQITPDYLELRGADLGPVRADTPSRLLVAARIGTTRLIDNVGVPW